ncbi:uncharacterized protein EHS24_007265 [Apiotrichum porosum]|uniref:Large ribosomal subunit protein mL44 n=1 Tax=Apiotrichum porosum TaxID=105984 RepID=A0A427XXQ4_9TREE|nr:uncharacterized protein EHS24_007265 [Apiotrichum porosum]RSH83577.1 hypothetical protein EHS24_007265 [Apiotrichum porosum]
MNALAPRSLLTGAFQRRLARTPLRRRVLAVAARDLSTTAPVFKPRRGPPAINPYSSSALAAFLARLSLPASADLHPALMAALTHPSYVHVAKKNLKEAMDQYNNDVSKGKEGLVEPELEVFETNELLASLGNSLLGLFAAEDIASRYPHMPSAALQQAVTAYVGPESCLSVGRELGLNVVNLKQALPNNAPVGVPIRWARSQSEPKEDAAAAVETPVARGYRPSRAEDENRIGRDVNTWGAGVSSVVRALVGLVYQEAGIHAARDFVTAHFMSRHVDLTAIFSITKPKHVLSSAVTKHLVNAGVPITPDTGRIQSRVLASTGATTQAPLFNIGLFLTNGLKLAEGHGSSLAMAEHRAAINALLSLFLMKNTNAGKLPTTMHASRPIANGAASLSTADVATEAGFSSAVGAGESESLVGLGKGLRAARKH